MMRGNSLIFCRGDRRRRTGVLLILIIIFHFGFGLVLLSFATSNAEQSKISFESILLSEHKLEDLTADALKSVKTNSQYYFRIDYTINEGVCIPIYTFNTTKNLISIQNLTNSKLRTLLSLDLPILTDIISFNPILKKSKKMRKNAIDEDTKTRCDYVLKLHIGFSFPSYCDTTCQFRELNYLTCQIRPFGDPINSSFILRLYSSKSITLFNISQVLLFQSSIYHDKSVYIRSYYQNRYLLVLILDADGSQLSITMSQNDRTLFVIKDGLYQNSSQLIEDYNQNKVSTIKINLLEEKYDQLYQNTVQLIEDDQQKNLSQINCSSLYISFLSKSVSNSYIRHDSRRIKIKKFSHSIGFKQDATFYLIFSKTIKDMVAFKSVNVEQSYIAIDPITPKGLVLEEYNLTHSNIDSFDQRFLFKLIYEE